MSLEQVMMSTAQITTAVTRIYYFRVELFEGTANKNETDFSNDKAAERDESRGQLDTVCLISSISRPVLLISGRLVG